MTTRSKQYSRKVFFHLIASAILVGGSTAAQAEQSATGSVDGSVNPTAPADPVELPAELQAIQRSLGGPSVNQFPSLSGRDGGGPEQRRALMEARSGGRSGAHRDAIRALRDAATQLDASANRLESLELYPQADALRQLAQQLRVDARTWSVKPGEPTRPTPAKGNDSRPAGDPLWNNAEPGPYGQSAPLYVRPPQGHTYSMPQLQPLPELDQRLAPRAPATRGESDATPLEPTPQPENRDDRPKPQPLLDSPQAEPKPDVEIEG